MKGVIVMIMVAVFFSLGCARVRVEAPKEPIKVDVTMRLDIYQHVVRDIDEIESIVSGAKEKAKPKNSQSLLNYFLENAYAQEGLSPEVEQAALRRRNRLAELNYWQEEAVVGENKSGLVEIRLREKADSTVEALAEAENKDRLIIYEAVAKRNNTSVEEVQKLYTKRLQEDAPAGTPIEVFDETSGTYKWRVKE